MTVLVTDGFEGSTLYTSVSGTYQNVSVSTSAAHAGSHSLYMPDDPVAEAKYAVTFPSSGMLGVRFFISPSSSNNFTFQLKTSSGTSICSITFNATSRLVSFSVVGGGSSSFTAGTFTGFLQFDVLYDTVFNLFRVVTNNGSVSGSCALASSPPTPAFVSFSSAGQPTVSTSFTNDSADNYGIIDSISSWSAGAVTINWHPDGSFGASPSYVSAYGSGLNTVAHLSSVPTSGTFTIQLYDGFSYVSLGLTYFTYSTQHFSTSLTAKGVYLDDVLITDRATIATSYSVGSSNVLAAGHSATGSANKRVVLTFTAVAESSVPTLQTARGYNVTLPATETAHAAGSAVQQAQRTFTTTTHGVASGSISRNVGGKVSLSPTVALSQQLAATRGGLIVLGAVIGSTDVANLARTFTASTGHVSSGLETRTITGAAATVGHATSFASHISRSVGQAIVPTICIASGSAVAHHLLTFTTTTVCEPGFVRGFTLRASESFGMGDAQPSAAVILPTVATITADNGGLMTLGVLS